jgi:uncharacterized repeat protein (TIGR04076 family)
MSDTERRERLAWKMVQRRLGYSDEELRVFQENPRNAELVAQALPLANARLVFEVVEAHGCNSGHKVGDRLTFDGQGNLLTESAPKRICAYALGATTPLMYAASELLYAGVDPNAMRFRRAGCIDVGLACGGWGRVVFELRAERIATTPTP